jgi:hypothetical protein
MIALIINNWLNITILLSAVYFLNKYYLNIWLSINSIVYFIFNIIHIKYGNYLNTLVIEILIFSVYVGAGYSSNQFYLFLTGGL